jgi:hypothetical protein
VDVGFFNVNYKSTLIISQDSKISNCRGNIAGMIYGTGSSIIFISNSTINDNKSPLSSVLAFQNVDIVQIANTQFYNNSLQDISAVEAARLTISRCTFTGGD